jgi:hypothetical protein
MFPDNCQGGVCSYPPTAPPLGGGPSNGQFGTVGGSFGGASSGGGFGGGGFGGSPGAGFGSGGPEICPSGESAAPHSGRCVKTAG